MENKSPEMAEERERKPELSVVEDLSLSVLSGPFGVACGLIGSWIEPSTLYRQGKRIREGTLTRNYNQFLCEAGVTAGYLFGVYKIIENVAEDPSDIKSYIPIALNAAAATIELGLNIFKRKKEKSRLETHLLV